MIELFREIKDYFDLTKEEPRNVALGAALAAFLGFVPLKCGLVALIVFLIGMTDASGTVAALLALLLKPLSVYVFDDTAVGIGKKVCESSFAQEHAGLFNAPGIALLGLERHHVMGGAVLGLLAAIPFFIVFHRLQKVVLKMREKAIEKAKELKAKRAAAAAAQAAEQGKDPAAAAAEVTAEKKPGCVGKVLGVWRSWNAIPLKKWIFLAILLGVFELFIAKPMMKKILKEKLPDGLAVSLGVVDPATGKVAKRGKVDFDDASFDFSLVRGHLHIQNLTITNPRNTNENLFQANAIDAKVSFASLLRKQLVVELLELDKPRLSVARESDGTLGIEPEPTPDQKAAAQAQASSDWATKAKSYLERAKKEYDEQKKKKAEAKKPETEKKPEAEKPKKPATLEDVLDRAEDGLPGESDELDASRWVVKEVKLSGFALDLQDPQSQAPSFAFNEGKLLEAAQNRLENGKPTVLDLAGSLVDMAKKEQGKLKVTFTEEPPDRNATKPVGWKLHAEVSDVSLHDSDALFANAIPLSFDKGTATIVVDAAGHGVDGDLDANPKISFKDVVAKARHPGEQIAGMPADKVATEVTNCGAFELNDIRITGCLLTPKVELGDTLKDLVVQGGAAYAKKKGKELLDKGVEKGLDKVEKKLPGAGDKVDDLKKKAGDLGIPNPFGGK